LWNNGGQAIPGLAGSARRTGWRYFRQRVFFQQIQPDKRIETAVIQP
jgi:hypothetical protein